MDHNVDQCSQNLSCIQIVVNFIVNFKDQSFVNLNLVVNFVSIQIEILYRLLIDYHLVFCGYLLLPPLIRVGPYIKITYNYIQSMNKGSIVLKDTPQKNSSVNRITHPHTLFIGTLSWQCFYCTQAIRTCIHYSKSYCYKYTNSVVSLHFN